MYGRDAELKSRMSREAESAARNTLAGLQQGGQIGGLGHPMQENCEVRPAREIPEKIERLFVQTEILSERIARLGGRLDRVLLPRPKAADATHSTGPLPYATAMGEQLAELAGRLELMIDAIDMIDAQLEL